eukprot:1151958-Pelagomonas_calceolata.AAC.6
MDFMCTFASSTEQHLLHLLASTSGKHLSTLETRAPGSSSTLRTRAVVNPSLIEMKIWRWTYIVYSYVVYSSWPASTSRCQGNKARPMACQDHDHSERFSNGSFSKFIGPQW